MIYPLSYWLPEYHSQSPGGPKRTFALNSKASPASHLFIIFPLLCLLFQLSGCQHIVHRQEEHIEGLESRLNELQTEMVALEFIIISRNQYAVQNYERTEHLNQTADQTITLRLRFLDLEGRQIFRTPLITLPGRIPFVEYFMVEVNQDQVLGFPYRLYSDALPPVQGLSLHPMYNEQGFPRIFYSSHSSLTPQDYLFLTRLFAAVSDPAGPQVEGYFSAVYALGSRWPEINDKERFGNQFYMGGGLFSQLPAAFLQTGQVYQIISRYKGGLEVRAKEGL